MVAAARLAANKGVQAAVKKFGKKVVDEAQGALEGAILSSIETTMVTQARGYAMKDQLYGNMDWDEETKRLQVVAADQTERTEPVWSFGIPTSPEDSYEQHIKKQGWFGIPTSSEDSYEQNVKKHHPHVTVQEDVPDQMTSYKPIPTAYSRSLRRELLGQKDDTRAKLGMIPS
ncbi:uncharacterized protein METZ01_LOCUS483569, partial [marine metagenome]